MNGNLFCNKQKGKKTGSHLRDNSHACGRRRGGGHKIIFRRSLWIKKKYITGYFETNL